MKQKKYLFIAAAAALFAACSSDDATLTTEKAPAQQQEVGFSAYVNRGTTRAGNTGEETLAEIKKANLGFGVFGFYTNADNYDQTFTPNFMYNQQVKFVSDKWIYSPVKYWPNEFGTGAMSEDVDKVSFFAYAPFVTVNPSSGKVMLGTGTYGGDNGDNTMGIVGMKRNNATGDPMIKYISTFYTDKQVDLLWGVVRNGQVWSLKQTSAAQDPAFTAGLPWLNVQHPYNTSSTWEKAAKVTFNFQHSLAALNVQVDTKVNSTSVADPAAGTKVYIRSVTFEGFDTEGALNLNNVKANTALWYNFSCEDELSNGNEITIKDGRKDGKEGITEATKEYAAINPTFVQSKVWGTSGETAGVTKTPLNLFAKYNGGTIASPTKATDPIYVIPNGDPLKVTIEYDVLTKDTNLQGKLNDGNTPGNVVKNVITRYINTNGNGSTTSGNFILENGKLYKINLHLGLNSVEFNALVEDWPTAAVEGGADLPHNN